MAKSPEPSIAEMATYISDTCADLRRVATHPRLRTINYLLDMARVEASRLAEAERTSERRQRGES